MFSELYFSFIHQFAVFVFVATEKLKAQTHFDYQKLFLRLNVFWLDLFFQVSFSKIILGVAIKTSHV